MYQLTSKRFSDSKLTSHREDMHRFSVTLSKEIVTINLFHLFVYFNNKDGWQMLINYF